MQNIEKNASKSAEKSSFFSSTKNKMLVTAGVVIVLFAALWIWKAAEIKNLKQEHDKREASLQQQTTDLLRQADYLYLKLLAKLYVWAIRTEMMKGNIDAVNLYANDMIKEKNFQTITVANENGVVVSSTNKKLEGKPYASIANAASLNSDSTVVNQADNGAVNVISPVMGFNKRIGTLIFNYMPPKAELK
ncbi:MAG: hypothetical protein WKF97_05305 [Chitinophagaceae bacterium]